MKNQKEKRAKLWADAGALLRSGINNHNRQSFDTMLADITAIDAEIARAEANDEARMCEHRKYRPQPGESFDPVEGTEVRHAKQKASFRRWMQTGEVESRDLVASGLSVAIPVGFNPQVVEAQLSYGDLFNMVDVLRTDSGEPVKYVLDDDTGNSLAAVTVGTDASETDPSLTGATLQVDNFTTGVIKVDMALLQDAGFDVDGWVRDRFARRYFRGASSLIYNGNGGNVAAYKSAITSTVTTGTVGAIAYNDLVSTQTALDPAWQNGAEWGISQAMLGNVLRLVDNNNRPLFLPDFGSADRGFIGTLLGKPVRLVQQMPSAIATGAQLLIYGQHKSAYVLRSVNPGLGIIRLNERYAPAFEVGFVAFARLGGISKQVGSAKPVVALIGK